MDKPGTPTKPGFYWYMVTRTVKTTAASEPETTKKLWCVAVESEWFKGQGLVGYPPMAEYPEPIDKDWNWPGEWLGEAIPPVPYDWPK